MGDDIAADAVFEVLGTARAMRYFTDEPVPDELVERVLWAATRASSPNNTQGWDFVVVRDPALRAQLGAAFSVMGKVIDAMPEPADPTDRRTLAGARNLAASMAQVPVLIFVCGRNIYPPTGPREQFMWSAVYAAAQNLVVAARALGLGAAFTTFHLVAEPQVRDLLRIPDEVHLRGTTPLGWPARPFGPVTRRPLREVVHRDGW